MDFSGHLLREALLPGYRLSSLAAPGFRLAALFKAGNQCHEPAGSPEGGEFCSTGGGGISAADFVGVGKTPFEKANEKLELALGKGGWGSRVAELSKAQVAKELAARLATNKDWQALANGQLGTYGQGKTPSERLASRVIHLWASTSGDNSPEAKVMQLAAREAFGLKDAQTGHMGMRNSATENKVWLDSAQWNKELNWDGKGREPRATSKDVAQYKAAMIAFTKAEYANTQAWLAKNGIKEVAVFRGVENLKATGSSPAVVSFVGQPLSSWSSDRDTAMDFGKTVLMAKFPASAVVSTARSGRGCLGEREIVVKGVPGRAIKASTRVHERTALRWIGKKAFGPIEGIKDFEPDFEKGNECHEPAGSPEGGQFCGGQPQGAKEGDKVGGHKSQIYNLLATGKSFSIPELVAATGASTERVRFMLSRLQNPKYAVTGKPVLVLQRNAVFGEHDRYSVVGTKKALTADERAALKGKKTEQAPVGTNSLSAASFQGSSGKPGQFAQANSKLNDLMETEHTGSSGSLKGSIAAQLGERLKEHADWNKVIEAVRLRQAAGMYGLPTEDKGMIAGKGETNSARLASRIIEGWAHTSGDQDDRAKAMQLAARDEFHMKNAALGHLKMSTTEQQEEVWRQAAQMFGFKGTVGRATPEEVDTFKAAMRAFTRAEYENTQAFFAAKGITEVSVFRGMKQSVDGTPTVKTLQGQPLSSFSSRLATARGFGKTVYMATFPVSHVVGSCQTGRGCLSEREVVILGHPIVTVRTSGERLISSANIDTVGRHAFKGAGPWG